MLSGYLLRVPLALSPALRVDLGWLCALLQYQPCLRPIHVGRDYLSCLEAGSIFERMHLGEKANLEHRILFSFSGGVRCWAGHCLHCSVLGSPGAPGLAGARKGQEFIRDHCKGA